MPPRLPLYLVASGVFLGALAGAYVKGRIDGGDRVQAKWNESNTRLALSQHLADEAQRKRFDALMEAHKTHNIEVSRDHQQAVDKLNTDLAHARAAVRVAGGLRVPSTICAGAAESGTKAGGDDRHDADTTGTVALPEHVTADLLDLAAEADRVTEIARSCQAWVRAQGFYQ